jgi:hypothetical protein
VERNFENFDQNFENNGQNFENKSPDFEKNELFFEPVSLTKYHNELSIITINPGH